MQKLSPMERKLLLRILAAAALLVGIRLLPDIQLPFPVPLLTDTLLSLDSGPAFFLRPWVLYLIPYLLIGGDILWNAARNIVRGQVFDEDFLMSIATVGAFATAEYSEAVFVMLFFQTGELFEHYAVGKSRRSIAELMDIRPDVAHVEQPDGSAAERAPEDAAVGDIIVVRPGERIPLDGVVVSGVSSLDTAALTGEALPRDVAAGDACISGCINLRGVLRIRVTRPCEESTVSRILELVETAGENKAVSEQFITRFARWYTPCVVCAAAALALVPPLFVGGWGDWFHRALIFLVVSCPCALVISVPLSFFGGIGAGSRCGILVKGSNYLEALAKAETVVFDKTGTLTRGRFTVTQVLPAEGVSEAQLLELAAAAEQYSDHPIALSLRAAVKSASVPVAEAEELTGLGVRAVVDGKTVCAGNRRLMEQLGIDAPAYTATSVHVAEDGRYCGAVLLADLPKEGAAEALAALKRCGVRRTVMLTGDAETAAAETAKALGVDEFRARLLPADKVREVEQLLKKTSRTLVFVGDGINDAPVLTRADVGVAMGALGSDAAIEAADIVLMDDDPRKIADAIRISRRTLAIVRQNIAFALGVKGLVLVLGALGRASMWLAVFADVGVAFLAILNAMRCLQTKHLK